MGLMVGVAIWGLLSLSWTAVAVADPMTDKIEKERKALDQLKDRIEKTREQADKAGKKRESLLQGIQTLDERLVRDRQAHQEITRKLRKKDEEIKVISAHLAGLRVNIEERKDAILARLRVQYMEGRFGHWKTLLASGSYGDFQRRLQYLSAVSERDYTLMGTFRSDVANMEQAERQREEARVGMLSYKQSTEKQLAKMKSVKKEKKVYLAKITHQKES
ncbi:MAG: hypothetical protein ABI955_07730, partial [Nitrospirota bacterium]